MDVRRQKSQLVLAFQREAEGEARSFRSEGTETFVRSRGNQSPTTSGLRRKSFNQPNRRVRTRTHGGVGGEEPRGSPLSRFTRPTAC